MALIAAVNANSVAFTADVGIRKLKSDLFLQAIITAYNHCLFEEEGVVSL